MREPFFGRGLWPVVFLLAAGLLLAWLLRQPIRDAMDWVFGVDRDPLCIRDEALPDCAGAALDPLKLR